MDELCKHHSNLESKDEVDAIFKHNLEMEKQVANIKATLHEKTKNYYFDVQIDCGRVILPAHKYVLSFRSKVLAQLLSANDINELDWTRYKASTGIALLRWIYTDTVPLDVVADVNLVLSLFHASYHFQLTPLFMACEANLYASVDGKTAHRIYAIASEVKAVALIDKCLAILRSNLPMMVDMQTNTDEDEEIESDIEWETDEDEHKDDVSKVQRQTKSIHKENKMLNKIVTGLNEYRNIADTSIVTGIGCWHAHAYFLGIRSEKIRDEIEAEEESDFYFSGLPTYGLFENIINIFLRWLYTDFVELNCRVALKLLPVARHYELPTLFDRCEQALIQSADITSCARIHEVATEVAAIALLHHCDRLIETFCNGLQSQAMSAVDLEVNSENSLCEMTNGESSSEDAGGLLTLNDDCLLHLFRYLSLVDLSSMKDTCKRLSHLADQSFKLYRGKSITIKSYSMFADMWTLKHFGKSITFLKFDGSYEKFVSYEEIFTMMAEFTGDKLKSVSLYLMYDSIKSDTLKPLEKLLKNIEIIQLHWLNNDQQVDMLLDFCENLKEVQIDGEEMVLHTHWCSKNVHVKSVTLSGIRGEHILHEICEKLPNLECLFVDRITIENPSNRIVQFGRLKYLRRLKVEAYEINMAGALQVFAAQNVLEYFCLEYADLSETLAQSLSYVPNVRELVFQNCDGFSQPVLRILSKTLANVEKLAFVECESITFEAITKIVENLLNLKELSISGCAEINFIDGRNYRRLIKKRNLQILLDNAAEYERSIEAIGNDLSNYVRVTFT